MILTDELIIQTLILLLLGIILFYPIIDYFVNEKVRKFNQEKFNNFNKKLKGNLKWLKKQVKKMMKV